MIYLRFDHLLCLRMCGRYSQSKGWNHNGRVLPANFLFLLESGDCKFEIDGRTYDLNVGDALVVPQGTRYLPSTDGGCSYQYFHFYAERLAEPPTSDSITSAADIELPSLIPHTLSLQSRMPTSYEIRKYLTSAIDGQRDNGSTRYVGMNLNFMLALNELSRNVCEGRRDITEVIKDYIEQYAFDDITLDGIASCFGYSKQHVVRIFSARFKISPMAYLERIRIQRGALLLSDNEMSISEIAESVGFSDANYFSRRFKKALGISPSEYRASLMSNFTDNAFV